MKEKFIEYRVYRITTNGKRVGRGKFFTLDEAIAETTRCWRVPNTESTEITEIIERKVKA